MATSSNECKGSIPTSLLSTCLGTHACSTITEEVHVFLSPNYDGRKCAKHLLSKLDEAC